MCIRDSSKYFVFDEAKDKFKVKDSLKEMVEFRQDNLVNMPSNLQGPFDLIFCRNVMIYFKTELKVRLLQEFARLLSKEGFLLVGHSESLLGQKEVFKSVEPTIYKKLFDKKEKWECR